MTALLFFLVSYLTLGLASAIGIRMRGIWDFEPTHSRECTTNYKYICRHSMWNNPLPVIGWIALIAAWPIVCLWIFGTWVFRFVRFVFYSIRPTLEFIGDLLMTKI